MIGRSNTGGGGSGGTLTVTGIAGHAVTATKDGKTYTRTFNSSGIAVFKGLSTGTWTLTMTGGGQTATRTVDVNADYAITITYFSATINVTYPSGSTCKATHTDGTVLNAPDTSGTWACVVPKSGTWTVLAEDTSSGKSKSVDVSITTEGQSESIILSYELYIFKSGSGLTTGYTFKNIASSSSSSDSLIANTNDEHVNNGSFYITPKTKFDGYSNLKFDLVGFKYTGQYSPNPNVRYGCSSNTTVTEGGVAPSASNYTASSNSLPTTRTTVSVDVSSISTEQYVKVETLDASLVIYNIWLE